MRKLINLIKHGKWTSCTHKHETIDHKYLVMCKDCGACLR